MNDDLYNGEALCFFFLGFILGLISAGLAMLLYLIW